MLGPQTAIVVGKKDEEIWTDKFGRVKVRFHWDRLSKSDEKSSCWIRVSQAWAGNAWGAIHIPRIGQEVVVSFLEGDPDQPIITGSVYNADQSPPYTLPDAQTQSGIKSQSTKGANSKNFNELRFEDKKDAELIYLHAERDFERIVENNDTLKVGFDKKTDGDQIISIDGTLEEVVTGAGYSRKATANGTDIVYGGKLAEIVNGQATRRVTGRSQETATGGWSVSAGRGVSITSLGGVSIQGTLPELPSLNTLNLEAAIGNVNINTMLGFLQLGGLSAISPMVLGDGLMMHHTMLALLSRAYNPVLALAYGPAMDAWAALTFPLDLSLFARVKRFPFG
jgi:type VI secretion system secreted protein VgrG